jgi:hypothetical protein
MSEAYHAEPPNSDNLEHKIGEIQWPTRPDLPPIKRPRLISSRRNKVEPKSPIIPSAASPSNLVPDLKGSLNKNIFNPDLTARSPRPPPGGRWCWGLLSNWCALTGPGVY